MANIKEYLDNILSAIFGKDVRQSIHDSIKAINEEVAESITTSQETKNRQDLLEQKYDDQIKNIASSEPQNAEIVDARGGFDTLGKIIKQKVFHFKNVDAMKNCLTLISGDVVQTLGYYEENDGGEGLYEIVNDSPLEDDGGSVHDLDNGLKAKLIIKDAINIKQFGAKGDGITDDTIPIQKAISLGNNVNFIKGEEYRITPQYDTFLLKSNTIINMNKSTIICNEDQITKTNVFLIQNITNVTIKNGKIIGNRTIKNLETEYSHAINILSSSYINIENMQITDFKGDSIIINEYGESGVPSTYINIKDCICNNAYRNNISVIHAEHVNIIDTVVSNANGTSPESGVDIEPNRTYQKVCDFYIRGCKFINNKRRGLLLSVQNNSEKIEADVFDSIFYGSEIQVHVTDTVGSSATGGHFNINNCYFDNAINNAIQILNHTKEQFPIIFKNCLISNGNKDNISTPVVTYSCIVLDCNNNNCENIKFEDIQIIESNFTRTVYVNGENKADFEFINCDNPKGFVIYKKDNVKLQETSRYNSYLSRNNSIPTSSYVFRSCYVKKQEDTAETDIIVGDLPENVDITFKNFSEHSIKIGDLEIPAKSFKTYNTTLKDFI